MIWPWQKLRHERHLMSVCQGDISERPILGFMIRFLPELRNFWKEKYENFNVFDFSFSKVYQIIRKLFYYSMQRPDLSLQNKIYKDWKISTNLNLWWTSICSKYWRFLPLLGSLLHTPPEQLLRKIKCSGHMANAEGLQIQVETWGEMSQLFW